MPSIEELRRYAVARGQDVANMSEAELLAFYNANEYGDDGVDLNKVVEDAGGLYADEVDGDAFEDAVADENVGGSLDAIIGNIAAKVAAKVAAEVAANTATPTVQVVVNQPDNAPPVVIDGAHHQLGDLIRAMGNDRGAPICIVGPAGGGKTHAWFQAAEARGQRCEYVGAIADRYVDYIGYEDSRGTYHPTAFRECWENGGDFLFDEGDGSNPNEFLPLNAVFAGAKTFRFPDGTVPRHPDFYAGLACNTYMNGADRVYVGRFQQDGAAKDRFIYLDWEYDDAIERAIACNDTWVDRVQQVRRAVEELDLRHVVSPRASNNGASLIRAGFTIEQAENMTFFASVDAATRERIEAHIAA